MQEVPDLIACEECDAVYRRVALGRDEVTFCHRCGAELERDMSSQRGRVLPLTIAGLFMYIIANAFPIVQMELRGVVNQVTLMGSVLALVAEGMHLVAFLVSITTILFPLIQLLALIYLLTALNGPERLGSRATVNLLTRMIQILRPWVMVEIFLLGVIVAFVKMKSIATVLPGIAVWALGALAFLFAAVLSFNPRHIWRKSLPGAEE
ncbi:MAG: paraquat-inducible protein A [Betaproteobacteria bacterium]|nr:paraquat-inducible protein A [Betaproteobacteria bacterium]